MELTLGPVLFEWKKEELLNFYAEVADMDIDRVYIGEVVCVKKRGLGFKDIEKVASTLEGSGKKVVLSSLAVVSNEDELKFTRDLVSMPFAVEANDISVLNMLDSKTKEVMAGPHITTYNVPSIEFLMSAGVRYVTFPVELSRESVSYNIKHTGVTSEVFGHGKVPLAFSWRCYASRAYGLSKTECRHDCARYPEGMGLKTLENEDVFNINGTSILSANTYTLVEFIDDLADIGVKAIRISPQHAGTSKIAEIFRKRLNKSIGPEEALAGIKNSSRGSLCNGWYMGGAGKDYIGRKDLTLKTS